MSIRKPDWFAQNIKAAYPFMQLPPVPDAAKRAFADANILVPTAYTKQVRLTAFTVSGNTFTLELKAGDDIILEGSDTLADVGLYKLARLGDVAENTYCTFVLNAEEVGSSWVLPSFHGNLAIRVLTAKPKTITGIYVNTDIGLVYLQGDIHLSEGYNVELQREEAQSLAIARKGTTVSIASQAGAGLGRVPADCEDGLPPEVLRTLSGEAPNEYGDLQLTGENGYRISVGIEASGPSGAVVSPGVISVANDNTPCCECDDYENAYNMLARAYQHALPVRDTVAAMASTANELTEEIPEDPRRIFRAMLRPLKNKVIGVTFQLENNALRPYDMSVWRNGCEGEELDLILTVERDEEHIKGRLVPNSTFVYHRGEMRWFEAPVGGVFDLECSQEGVGEDKKTVHIAPEISIGGLSMHVVPPTSYLAIYFELEVYSSDAEKPVTRGDTIELHFESRQKALGWESPDSPEHAADEDSDREPVYVYTEAIKLR